VKRLVAAFCALALALPGPAAITAIVATPAHAQSNDNDYTPLNSRIRRNRQFPTSLINPYRGEVGSATRERSRQMMGRFTRCIYNRSNEGALDFLSRTDYGIQSFQQLDLENDRASRIYGFQDCLRRVANSFNTGVQLSWTAFGLRRWFIEQAYLDRYPDGPEWLQAGYVIDERTYPLSSDNPGIAVAMNLADCLVAADPFTADYLFRTTAGSEEEMAVINTLVPAVQPCLPQGQRVEINPDTLRVWIGEALWHASNHSSPPPPEGTEIAETQRAPTQVAAPADPMSDPGERAELRRIAHCVLENSTEQSLAMLDSGTVNIASDGQFDAIMQENLTCLTRQTYISRMVVVGFMAEELYQQNGVSLASALPEDFEVTSLGLCVLARDPEVANALDAMVGVEPGSEEETAAVEAMRGAWESCAPTAPFQAAMVRGSMMTEVYPLVWENS